MAGEGRHFQRGWGNPRHFPRPRQTYEERVQTSLRAREIYMRCEGHPEEKIQGEIANFKMIYRKLYKNFDESEYFKEGVIKENLEKTLKHELDNTNLSPPGYKEETKREIGTDQGFREKIVSSELARKKRSGDVEGSTSEILAEGEDRDSVPLVEHAEVLKTLYGGAFDEIYTDWIWRPSEKEKTEIVRDIKTRGILEKVYPADFNWLALKVSVDLPITTNNRRERFLITELLPCGEGRYFEIEDKDKPGRIRLSWRHTIKGAAIFSYSRQDKKWMLKKEDKYISAGRALDKPHGEEQQLLLVGPDRFGLVISDYDTGSYYTSGFLHVIAENKDSIQRLGTFGTDNMWGVPCMEDKPDFYCSQGEKLISIKFVPNPTTMNVYYNLDITTVAYHSEGGKEREYSNSPKTRSYVWSESQSKYQLVNASD